ncbi:MAG: DUF1365 domain-containing protein [Rhodanobacteraceae bacterium]|nr:DUF1365 domain-containing protein [Rhodanobacteraceae bacterium]MBK7043239.1 DUF1365 domain-containing protein [Rhodanobacteraceae bacterium]MBP9153963.1 DUF1365 domain-containing protein [Xanthomonadales bacterium]HQW82237.1 DUF1365 domain-containing protein [Pseudomonadota bacterium]
MSRDFASAIYRGNVRHRRHVPCAHAFAYTTAYLYVDLDEIDDVIALNLFWSRDRRNLAEFRRSDYHGDASVPLADAVRDTVLARIGRRPSGPIRLLTQARYFGHCFNPVSFYYCFENDGQTLDVIVAEITNTPWKERHAYVLPAKDGERHGDALHFRFDKRFHVSPFMPMARQYDWRFQVPSSHLRVHMDVNRDTARDFDATLVLEREPMSRAALNQLLWRYPLMTLKVVAAIHWQAFIIWCKRAPVYDHPEKSKADP